MSTRKARITLNLAIAALALLAVAAVTAGARSQMSPSGGMSEFQQAVSAGFTYQG